MKVPDSELRALIELENSAVATMHSLRGSAAEVEDMLSHDLAIDAGSHRVGDLLDLLDQIEERIEEASEQLEELQSLIDIVLDGQWLPSEIEILDGFEPLETEEDES
jgi:hypothetical protein